MILSIWRYCHLSLALISAIFLIIAAVTGTVLAFSPVHNKNTKYSAKHLDKITVSNFIKNLKKSNAEILEISIDDDNYVKVKAADKNGDMKKFYANINDGSSIGEVKKNQNYTLYLKTSIDHYFLKKLVG